MPIAPRTSEELDLMRKSGRISAKALKRALDASIQGVSLLEINKVAEDEILKLGGEASFKTEPGYNFATCLTINNEVVHGIPRGIKLKLGDVLSIDVGAIYKGWHTDTAWSKVVGKESSEFLKVGEKALWAGIDKAVDGNRIGDISAAIQDIVEGAGYKIVKSLVGHGVGKKLHEDPEIPGFGTRGTGSLLKAGETLAIEVIYTSGSGEVEHSSDGWTIISSDGSMGGLFEMSVVVGKKSPEILTDWRDI